MFAGFEKQKMTMVLALLVTLVAGLSSAATLDPLLRGLAQDKASGTTGLTYENFLVVDTAISSDDPMVGVILRLEGSHADLNSVPGLIVGSRTGQYVTARLPLSSLPWLEADESIAHVDAARLLKPLMDAALVDGQVDDVWAGSPAYTGAGTLVGIIDSGIDWSHNDFNNASGDTRIKYIWDMFGSGTPPEGFLDGVEYNETQINAGSPAEADYSGHGTHVSGIAAGNGYESSGLYSGVAPDAGIIFAKAFDDNMGGFPEDMVIDAIIYLADKADQLGLPIAINMSLGGHMGPHDGTSAQEEIIDTISGEGVVFCIAAGNEGEDFHHDSGPAANTDIIYNIPEYTSNSGTGNDYSILDIWVDGASSPSVSVSYGGSVVAAASSGNSNSAQGAFGYVLIQNALSNPTNGDKEIVIQFDDRTGTAPAFGDWTITISGGSGTAHAWIATATMVTEFPNSDQSHSVGMPGTCVSAITVAAHKTKGVWTSAVGNVGYDGSWGAVDDGDHAPFSSFGPTRDGREKPDVSAPGMGMFAPFSGDTSPLPNDGWMSPDRNYFFSQGTSMASPFVCGVAALMLEKNSTLTADQIKTAMRESAATDAYTGAVWNNGFGAGKIDALAAVQAVASLGPAPTGDVNGDGTTSVLDLVLLANHIADAAAYPLGSEARIQGDVYPAPNGDGVLNVSDLARMVSFILETDAPGNSPQPLQPASFELAQPLWQDGQWWQPVTITGQGMAAGQFALNLDDAIWQPENLICDVNLPVVASVFGTQLRVLFYDLSGNFPAEGVNILIPFEAASNQPSMARTAGVLMVSATGQPMDTQESRFQPAGFLNVSPNPAPGDMMISFSRDSGRSYDLSVFDLRGRRVRNMSRGNAEEGNGAMVFDGRDDSGHQLPAGIYFVHLNSGGRTLTKKVVLTR